MKSRSRTYRLIALLTGFLILAGVSTPTSIYAWTVHCDMQMESPVSDHHQHDQLPEHHADQTDTGDCHTGITCGCCTMQSAVNPQSTNPLNRTKADLESVIAGTIDPSLSTAVEVGQPLLHQAANSSSPPLFLMNSAFLN